jgi:hypothetical protein
MKQRHPSPFLKQLHPSPFLKQRPQNQEEPKPKNEGRPKKKVTFKVEGALQKKVDECGTSEKKEEQEDEELLVDSKGNFYVRLINQPHKVRRLERVSENQ